MEDADPSTARGATYNGPATWSLNIVTGELGSSPARALMLDYEPARAPTTSDGWDALLHPDDRFAVRTARARHILGDGSGYRSEYRARRSDGRWAWLLEVGCIERDARGHAVKVLGVLLDITNDREAQFLQQQRLERLRTIFDYTFQFMGLLSKDGVMIETNRTSLKAAGVSLDEAIGKPFWQTPFWFHQTPKEIEELRDGVERASRGEFVRLQHTIKPPSGAPRIIDFSLLPVLDDEGHVAWILPEGRDVTDIVNAHREVRKLEDRLAVVTTSANIGLWDHNPQTGEFWVNDHYWNMLGYAADELTPDMATWQRLLHVNDLAHAQAMMQQVTANRPAFRLEYRMRCKDGSWRWIHSSGRTVEWDEHGAPLRVAGVHLDVTERKETEMRLASAERLESVGKLAAGIAHEINTPIQFVSDSVYFIKDAVTELLQLSERLRNAAPQEVKSANSVHDIGADIPYFADNLPKALERSLDGLKRVTEIVRSMKEFAHPDQPEMLEVDINRAIEHSLVVARSEYKHIAELQTDFGTLPMVRCHGGELNQVILNLLVNASHAVADVVKDSGSKGLIKVSTHQDSDGIVIAIADNGAGVPENIRHRIFEPFFTTKEVGRGTGQGLAIAHHIIVKRHGGRIEFHTETGQGTTFYLHLPLDCRQEPAREQAA